MHDELDDPEFLKRMEQASLLAGHDPVRIAVAQEVAARGGEEGAAGRLWLGLLEEAERMKLALMTLNVPANLEQRLLRVAHTPTVPWWKRPASEVLTPRRLAVAAAIMLIVGAGWWGLASLLAFREGRQVDRVALLAADVHQALLQAAPAERIDTANPDVAQAWLQSRVNFPAIILGGGGAKLTGASVVHLGTAPAALTQWKEDGHRYSLLEFAPGTLGLSAEFAKRVANGPPIAGTPCKIVMWSNPAQGCGWALVMDSSARDTFTY